MLSFELATQETIPAILEMMEEFYAIDHYPFNKKKNHKNLQVFIDNPQLGRLWMIRKESHLVGYVCLAYCFSFEYGGRDAFIDEFFIKKDFRNQGIGQHTLEFLEKESPKLGVHSLHLEVEKHNEAGKKLYFNKGYSDTGRHLLTKTVIE